MSPKATIVLAKIKEAQRKHWALERPGRPAVLLSLTEFHDLIDGVCVGSMVLPVSTIGDATMAFGVRIIVGEVV